jgi:hypothetical protein
MVRLTATLQASEHYLMVPPFDIYKLKSNGELLWIGTESSLEAAKEFVTKLGYSKPGEYVICSLTNKPQVWMKVPSAAKAASG